MSKKSYKQMQNRLYREIKRRMLLELCKVNLEMNHFQVWNRRIETIGVMRYVRDDDYMMPEVKEIIKSNLAACIARKLVEGGYVAFRERPGRPCNGCHQVEARLKVIKPEQEDKHDDNGLL